MTLSDGFIGDPDGAFIWMDPTFFSAETIRAMHDRFRFNEIAVALADWEDDLHRRCGLPPILRVGQSEAAP